MATGTASSKPAARQLGELLQQQQEPFILEIYLSERGCLRKKLTSGAKYTICCHGSSGKFLQKNKKGIPNFPKVLKVLICNKFFAIKGLKTKNYDDENGKVSVTEMKRNDQEIAEPDRFSSASSTTVYNSCSDSDIDEPLMITDDSKSKLKLYNEREKKTVADSKFQWSSMEDSKQDSPQSVLGEMLSTSTISPVDKTRSVSSLFLSKLIMEDSVLSASLWKFILQTTPALRELQEADGSNSSPFSISKRVLQQTKKVPFDNNHEKDEERKEFLGTKEIGKVICEKIKDFGKRYGDELSNTMKLLELDVMDSTQEWNDYEHQKKDVELVIGNAIAEEITTEVVKDMILMFHS